MQVAKDPLRAAFLIWGAYAIETLLLHREPKDEEFRALATMSSLYAAAEWLKKHPTSQIAQEVAKKGINTHPATQVKLVFEMKDEVWERETRETSPQPVLPKTA